MDSGVCFTTDVKREDRLLMSSSGASRTVAMIDAARSRVESNWSVVRVVVLREKAEERRYLENAFKRSNEAPLG
jgi:hypothetical protein